VKKLHQEIDKKSPPMEEAKDEMNQIKKQSRTLLNSFKELRSKVNTAREKLIAKEKAERNAHIEAKELKEAAVILESVPKQVEEMDAALAAFEEKAKAFTAEKADSLDKPATLAGEIEKLASTASEKGKLVRTAANEKVAVANGITPPTAASKRAKQQLIASSIKVDQLDKKVSQLSKEVEKICNGITDKYTDVASKALRDEISKKGSDAKALFEQLSGKSEKIDEDKFCKKLKSLNVEIPPEHARLVCRRVGVSEQKFLGFVEVFYKVIKDTALCDKVDIKESATIRKLERKEVLKVLEGPTTDEKYGMTRLRVQCLSDNATGWATAKGNQGTVFLEQTTRPADKTEKDEKVEKSAKA